MHEDPQVPNYFSPELEKYDFQLTPGMVLAVEPMLNAGTADVRLLDDHWTIVTADGRPSVHYEHTLAITPEGIRILTAL
jgi:methionyl aminopeptidase